MLSFENLFFISLLYGEVIPLIVKAPTIISTFLVLNLSVRYFDLDDRSFFARPNDDDDDVKRELGDGLQVWDGLFQSCVLGWKTSFLNVDG